MFRLFFRRFSQQLLQNIVPDSADQRIQLAFVLFQFPILHFQFDYFIGMVPVCRFESDIFFFELLHLGFQFRVFPKERTGVFQELSENRKRFLLPKRLTGFQYPGFRKQPFGIVVFPNKFLGILENRRDIVELFLLFGKCSCSDSRLFL